MSKLSKEAVLLTQNAEYKKNKRNAPALVCFFHLFVNKLNNQQLISSLINVIMSTISNYLMYSSSKLFLFHVYMKIFGTFCVVIKH